MDFLSYSCDLHHYSGCGGGQYQLDRGECNGNLCGGLNCSTCASCPTGWYKGPGCSTDETSCLECPEQMTSNAANTNCIADIVTDDTTCCATNDYYDPEAGGRLGGIISGFAVQENGCYFGPLSGVGGCNLSHVEGCGGGQYQVSREPCVGDNCVGYFNCSTCESCPDGWYKGLGCSTTETSCTACPNGYSSNAAKTGCQ